MHSGLPSKKDGYCSAVPHSADCRRKVRVASQNRLEVLIRGVLDDTKKGAGASSSGMSSSLLLIRVIGKIERSRAIVLDNK